MCGGDRVRQDRSHDPEATTSRVKKQVTREQNQTPKQKQKPVELQSRSSTERILYATTPKEPRLRLTISFRNGSVGALAIEVNSEEAG